MKLKIINTFIWVAIGFAIGFFAFNGLRKYPVKPVAVVPREVIKEADAKIAPIQNNYDSLLAVVGKLQAEAGNVKNELRKERVNRKTAELALNASLTALADTQTVEGVTAAQQSAEDYTFAVATADAVCDSVVEVYERQNEYKNEMLERKDSIIAVHVATIDTLAAGLEQQIKYSGKLEKKVKRQKVVINIVKSVAIAAGLLFTKNAVLK